MKSSSFCLLLAFMQLLAILTADATGSESGFYLVSLTICLVGCNICTAIEGIKS